MLCSAFSIAVDDLALDRLGRGARIGDRHHHHRLLDVGDLVHAQLVQREQPQAHQRDDDDDRRDRPLDAEVGEEHGEARYLRGPGAIAALVEPAACTGWSSFSSAVG